MRDPLKLEHLLRGGKKGKEKMARKRNGAKKAGAGRDFLRPVCRNYSDNY
jgi:hypothetical protein